MEDIRSKNITVGRLLEYLATRKVESEDDYIEVLEDIAMWAHETKKAKKAAADRKVASQPSTQKVSITLEQLDEIIDSEARLSKIHMTADISYKGLDELTKLSLIDQQAKVNHDHFVRYRALVDVKKRIHVALGDLKEIRSI